MASFERASTPTKRKSSILKQPKRNRDSRTVSFSDKFFYKQLYEDGTYEDMDITMMEVVEPLETTTSSTVSMSTDETVNELSKLSKTMNETGCYERSLDEKDMITMTQEFSFDDTLFGAFHDSNNLSMLSNRTSGVDTIMHNIEALNECIQRVDHESEECKRRLDAEIQDLFKFYRHIVNKDDEYEFAIAIFGLRHSLWLIIKIDPETYPNEKLRLRFAVKKQDRHLYPFKEYAEAVRRYTKEGSYGYLTRFVINAQRFRRFLKKIGYRKTNA